MDKQALLDIMKSQQEAYLAAFRTGYEKGFNDACDRALELLNKPKRKYKKGETE